MSARKSVDEVSIHDVIHHGDNDAAKVQADLRSAALDKAAVAMLDFTTFGCTLMDIGHDIHGALLSKESAQEVVRFPTDVLLTRLHGIAMELESRVHVGVTCLTEFEAKIDVLIHTARTLIGLIRPRLEKSEAILQHCIHHSVSRAEICKIWKLDDFAALAAELVHLKNDSASIIGQAFELVLHGPSHQPGRSGKHVSYRKCWSRQELKASCDHDHDNLNLDALMEENHVCYHQSLIDLFKTEKALLKRGTSAKNEIEHETMRQNASSAFAQLSAQHAPVASALSQDQKSLLEEFLLEKLAFKAMRDREEEVTEAHRETFAWIFHHDKGKETEKPSNLFPEWLSSDKLGNIFWMSGKPGSGKSTLMHFVYNHIETRKYLQVWNNGSRPVILGGFFFWISGLPEQKSIEGLLRTLLHDLMQQYPQLISKALPDVWSSVANATTKERISMTFEWTFQQMWHGLKKVLEMIIKTRKVCLFIDGLDELEGDHIRHKELTDLLKELTNRHDGKLKICVSSRPFAVFEEAFIGVPTLRLQELSFVDLKQYVEDKFKEDEQFWRIRKGEPERASELLSSIVEKADGVFLWVTLAVKFLLENLPVQQRIVDVQDCLNQLPSQLDDLFHFTLFACQSTRMTRISMIFQLMRTRETVCNFTNQKDVSALTLWELTCAMVEGVCDPETSETTLLNRQSTMVPLARVAEVQTEIRSGFAGLLQLTEKKGPANDDVFPYHTERASELNLFNARIGYVHRTVRDWLVKPRIWNEILMKTIGNTLDMHLAHLRAQTMILSTPKLEGNTLRRTRQLDDFWSACVLASTHARFIETRHASHTIAALAAFDRSVTDRWSGRGPDDHWARSTFGSFEARNKTLIHYPFLGLATKFGLDVLVGHAAKMKWYEPQHGQELLGHANEYLATRRLSVYPLSHPKLVDMLLRSGIDPNKGYIDFSKKMTTPWLKVLKTLRDATRLNDIGHYSTGPAGVERWTAIVELFLEYGADVNAVLVETRLDPAATAMDVIGSICQKTMDGRVIRIQQMLRDRGGHTSRADATELGMPSKLSSQQIASAP